MPSSSSPFLAQSSTKSSVNNKTIVQAYPAIIALNGSQVSIPCNISHYQTSTTKLTKSTTDFVPPTNGTNDTPNLILWYRGEDISGSPIYTVDGRDQNVRPMWQLTNETNSREATKRHFIAPELSKRARVDLSIRPAMLIIDNIDSSDSGIYWCRVDFRWTRTLISMVELQVNVVPSSMYIWAETLLSSINLDQTKSDSNSFYSNSPSNDLLSKSFSTSSTTLLHQNYATSSINNNNNSKLFINANEGGNLRLFCESYGGVPTPSVIWFDDNGNVQQSSTYQFNVTNIGDVQSFYETIVFPSQNEHEIDHWKRTIQLEQKSNRRPTITASNGESTLLVISVMTLYRLNRTQSQANFSCLANNTNLAPAIKRTIQIDLNLHPSHVTINPPSGSYLSDGLKTEVNCRAYGGRPYSLISWFLDQENITHLSDYDFEVNFTTSSVLKFTPNWKNDQRRLVCLAYNPTIVAHSNVNRSTLADVMTPIGVEPSNARIGINGIDSVWHTLPMGHHHLHHQQRSKTFVTDSLVLDIKYVPQIKLIHRMPFLPAWHNYQPQIAARYFRPNYTEFDGIMVDRNRMSYVHVDEG